MEKYTNFALYDIVTAGDEEELLALKEVTLQGWVRTNRDNGSIGFVEFNDGTYFKNVQLVYNKESKDYETLSKLKTGSAITVTGRESCRPPREILPYWRPSARAIDLPREVLPTPGGP